MQSIHTYEIKLRNRMDVDGFNATSPVQVMVRRVEAEATLVTICADQATLIGLLRHLHQQGYALLSLCREG
jgi:hypothetical protein